MCTVTAVAVHAVLARDGGNGANGTDGTEGNKARKAVTARNRRDRSPFISTQRVEWRMRSPGGSPALIASLKFRAARRAVRERSARPDDCS